MQKIVFTFQETISFVFRNKSGNIPRTQFYGLLYPFFCAFKSQQMFLGAVSSLANIWQITRKKKNYTPVQYHN